MITYNWRAEFSQKELEAIKVRKKWRGDQECAAVREEMATVLIAEMSNALDRYEAILNDTLPKNEFTRNAKKRPFCPIPMFGVKITL